MRTYLNSGLFLSAILLFFLPFFELRCGDGSRFAQMNGFDMAFARGIQFESEESAVYFEQNPEIKKKMKEKNRPDMFTLLALFALFAGLVIQFVPGIKRGLVSVILAIVSILVLSGMMFMVNHIWTQQMAAAMENPFIRKMVVVSLEYGYGVWLVIGLCVFIATINVIFILNDRKSAFLDVYVPPEVQ
jgi:hypothetical protein